MRLGAVTHPRVPLSLLSGRRSLFCLSRAGRAAVLPQNPSTERSLWGWIWGEKRGENCNCLRARGDTRSFCLSCYHLLPSTFICKDKNPIVYLKLLFNSLCACTYIYIFCFVLRLPGEFLDGKQPGLQDKVFCLLRGLFIVFLPTETTFLSLPVRRQRANTPLGFTVRGKMQFGGLNMGVFRLGC